MLCHISYVILRKIQILFHAPDKQERIASDMAKVSLTENDASTVLNADNNEMANDNQSTDSDATAADALESEDHGKTSRGRSSNIDTQKKTKLLAALRAIDANEY